MFITNFSHSLGYMSKYNTFNIFDLILIVNDKKLHLVLCPSNNLF